MEEKFETLWLRYKRPIFGYLLAHARQPADAEDLLLITPDIANDSLTDIIILDFLMTLPAQWASAMYLHLYYHEKPKDLAKKLHMRVPSVSKHLYRLKKELEIVLKGDESK